MPAFLTWLTTRNDATTLDGTELFIAEQASGNVRVTAQQIATFSDGTTRSFGSVADATAYSFGADVDAALIAGYTTAGDGGAALYARAASQPEHDGWFQSADGAYWELAEREPNAHMFGAKGDNVQDDTTHIQAAVNYCLYKNYPTCHLLTGRYKTTDTIHLGFTDFTTIVLRGDGVLPNGVYCAWIWPNFTDRPAINIQGGRASGVVDVRIYNQTDANNLLPIQVPYNSSLLEAVDPTNYYIPGSSIDPYAPCCAVAIDGYSGTAPASPYPIPTYPSWLTQPTTAADAYGRGNSSNCRVKVDAVATVVGICLQSNADANGDFMDFSDSVLTQQLVGISVGNVNARVTNFDRCNFSVCHTGIDSVQFSHGGGGGGGNIQGSMNSMAFGQCYRLLNTTIDSSEPIVMIHCYSELCMTLGTVIGGGLVCIGCSFSYVTARYSSGTRVEEYFEHFLDCEGRLRFTNCAFTGADFVFAFVGNPIFEECLIQPAWVFNTAKRTADERAAAVAHGLVLTVPRQAPDSDPQHKTFRKTKIYGVDGTSDALLYSSIDTSSIQTFHADGMSAQSGGWTPYVVNNEARVGSLGDFLSTLTSVSGREATRTTALTYFQVGDFLFTAGYDGTWWYVSAISGAGPYDVTFVPMNNYKYESSTYSLLDATVTDGASYYFPASALRSPQSNIYYSTTSGSPTVDCIDNSAAATAPPSDVVVGDKVLWIGTDARTASNIAHRIPFGENVIVSAVNATSLTMTGNATKTAYWQCGPGIARADV